MSSTLYVCSVTSGSGKSVVTLGMAEFIKRRVNKLGFFRPVVRESSTVDNDTELIGTRYAKHLSTKAMIGVTQAEARAGAASRARFDQVLQRILERFKAVQRNSDFVLCEGTDVDGEFPFAFNFNAEIAKHLGCPMLLILHGLGQNNGQLLDLARATREEFVQSGANVSAIVINRVDSEQLDSLQQAIANSWDHEQHVYLIPEHPSLGQPTIEEVRRHLNAELLHGEESGMYREATRLKVAAMQLPNFLERHEPNSLVITPGDRYDVLVGCLTIANSESYPSPAGVLLTGGLRPPEAMMRLMKSDDAKDLPIMLVQEDTYTATRLVSRIHPKIAPNNERKIAAALGLFETAIDTESLLKQVDLTAPTGMTPLMFEYQLVEWARRNRMHVVLPESDDDRILRAADILLRRNAVDITLLGNPNSIRRRASALGVELDEAAMIEPELSPWREQFVDVYYELRKHKGINHEVARDRLLDVNYFGTMMVHMGYADAMVSGAAHTTGDTIRPALEIIRTREGCQTVSSVFFMCLRNRVLVYGDCAIVPNPTAEQLADIAISSADTARMFGVEPCVAMLSYSTGESGRGADVDHVREATRLAKAARPDLLIDGPMQYDAAIDAQVGSKKLPGSKVAGKATVFIFPDLNTGNNTYKAVQRSSGAVAVGPVLQGLNKPVNDLSRGCPVSDIVNTVLISAIQAHAAASEQPSLH